MSEPVDTSNTSKRIILFEKIFAIIAFIHYSGGPLLLFLSNGMSEGDEGELPSYPAINAIFLLIYFVTFCLLVLRWKKVIFVVSKCKVFWGLYLLTILSVFWSYSPEITKIRLLAITGTLLFSLYLASRYTLKEQLQLFGWIFGTIVVACILFAILLPKFGMMGGVHQGAWRGIYNHKNVLGKIMLPSALVFYFLAITSVGRKWMLWGFFGASIMLIVLSRASSPLLNMIVLMILLFVLHALRWKYLFLFPALIGILSLGIILQVLLVNYAEQIVGIFGKNLTLTGRTNFWPLMMDKIWERPWLGYGFGAFWQGLDGPSAYVWNASEFKAPNGHNGYLDLCVQLGFVGLSLYALVFVSSVYKALAYIRATKTPDGFWPTLLFVYVILSNLTETSLVLQNSFLWIMELSVCLSLCIPQSNKDNNLIWGNHGYSS